MKWLPQMLLAGVAWLTLGAPALPAETPEQRFFDWSDLQFSREVHAVRRATLGTALAETRPIFLAPSRDGFSSGETFRQLDDFLYFTGLEFPNSVLAIDADSGKSILFAPEWDARFANPSRRNDFPGRKLALDPELAENSGIDDIRPIVELDAALEKWVAAGRRLALGLSPRQTLERADLDLLQELSPTQIFHQRLLDRYPTAVIDPAFNQVAALRMIKGPEEIAILRQAAEVTSSGIRAAASILREGVTERHLEAEFEAELKRRGAQRLAFDSIIKSGPNSLWPWRILASHYDRRNRTVEEGELVIFDVGGEFDHYSRDVGRTLPVSGRFTDDQTRLVEMVRSVSDAVIAAAQPGTTLAALQEIADATIPADERRYMQTGLFFGHHIGLAVGDPSLADAELAPGMIFTVEPWYYNHDRGVAVFIEDEVLITPTGAENLTAGLPRDAAALERLVRANQEEPR
jgi:Xaa-Pro aminopeptidase